VCLEAELNKLPPHWLYDYRIDLEGDNNLGYSLLYKMTTKELKIVKQYLINNLYKGFITPS
jgi:hypothetical protein